MTRLFRGFWVSQAIYVAVQLGIADLLADGPRPISELAATAGAHESSLARVMRLLASEGVFAGREDGRFELTPLAATLRRDAGPLSLQVSFLGGEASWRAAGKLLHTVRTGETAFEHVHGMDFFEYYRQHPDERTLFDRLMVAQTTPAAIAVAAVYDFSPIASVVDVGGGRGALTIEVLKAHPHLRGLVFDQPGVAEDARQAIAAAGLTERCEAVEGDMFTAIPEGRDAYLLKYILHDWDDDRCVAILRSCRRAMTAGSRLLVVEQLLPKGNAPSFAKTQDMNMLINVGGRERSESEFAGLFEKAGFGLTRTVPVAGDMHIIEGSPV